MIEPYKNYEDAMQRTPLIAVTGHPGMGKTTWTTSILSEIPDTYFFELEPNGYTAALSNDACLAWLKKKEVPTFPFDRCFPCKSAEHFISTLYEKFLDPVLKKGGEPVCKALVIDSATALSDMWEEQVGTHIEDGRGIQRWGKIKRNWRKILMDLQNSGYIVVWTVHMKDAAETPDLSKQVKAEREDATWILPDIAGGGKKTFMRRMDWYLHLDRQGNGIHTKINLYTQSHKDIFAKCRGNFPVKVTDLGLGEMLKLAGYLG